MVSPLMRVLVAVVSTALAFEGIRIPSEVTADAETEVTITNDIADGSKSFDAGFAKYRLYLALTPPGWGSGPACTLVNASGISVTSLKVKIPADIVPDGTKLMVSTMEFNDDPTLDGPSAFEYSNEFTLKGGTGKWSEAELKGSGVGDADIIPCSAYSCARACNTKFYPANADTKGDEEAFEAALKSTFECLAECPAVKLPAEIRNSFNITGGPKSTSSTSPGPSSTGGAGTPTETPGSGQRISLSISSLLFGALVTVVFVHL